MDFVSPLLYNKTKGVVVMYNRNSRNNRRERIDFEIQATFGVIGLGNKGWKKEINLIKWGDNEAKIDIRDWDETHTKMGKGITLTMQELKNIKALLNGNKEEVVLVAPQPKKEEEVAPVKVAQVDLSTAIC